MRGTSPGGAFEMSLLTTRAAPRLYERECVSKRQQHRSIQRARRELRGPPRDDDDDDGAAVVVQRAVRAARRRGGRALGALARLVQDAPRGHREEHEGHGKRGEERLVGPEGRDGEDGVFFPCALAPAWMTSASHDAHTVADTMDLMTLERMVALRKLTTACAWLVAARDPYCRRQG